MNNVTINNNEFFFTRKNELVRVSACGKNAIRFQGFPDARFVDKSYTLIPKEESGIIEETERSISLTVGKLKLTLFNNGSIEVHFGDKKIIKEKPELTFNDGFRRYENIGDKMWKAKITFEPHENEHFYGLGHSFDSLFDLKGSSIDIRNVNAKCTIPYVYSSMGYGLVWNIPSTGLCELTNNHTRFSSDCCEFIDLIIIGGTPKEATQTLCDLYGYAPKIPHWATGFWQSRLRYETQDMLLDVARRYKEENIPLSAIVCDYFHWTEQGDYKFDEKYWPNVKAMTDELHSMGTKLVVSVWPTINENSENYWHMSTHNLLMRTTKGNGRVFDFYGPQFEIDVTNPKTREFVWSKLQKNYIENGVDALWFDEAEPEIHPEHFDNLLLYEGRGDKVGLLYPYYYSKLAFDGFKSIGQEEIATLTRCAYLGSQKFASVVWSGDIPSTFESLSTQVKGGLNMAMCGIPWWNTDIGGFYGGDTTSEEYRELILRWFQFGVFSPIMRLHGNRNRHGESSGLKESSGDPNEIWSFGEENFPILKELVLLRERLRPYIEEQFETSSTLGYPVMRPMFFEYPDDEICYSLDNQYFFGDDIIFAPIVNKGQTEKEVYIPDGEWILTKNKAILGKGWHKISAQKNEFIALVRKGASVIDVF